MGSSSITEKDEMEPERKLGWYISLQFQQYTMAMHEFSHKHPKLVMIKTAYMRGSGQKWVTWRPRSKIKHTGEIARSRWTFFRVAPILFHTRSPRTRKARLTLQRERERKMDEVEFSRRSSGRGQRQKSERRQTRLPWCWQPVSFPFISLIDMRGISLRGQILSRH